MVQKQFEKVVDKVCSQIDELSEKIWWLQIDIERIAEQENILVKYLLGEPSSKFDYWVYYSKSSSADIPLSKTKLIDCAIVDANQK